MSLPSSFNVSFFEISISVSYTGVLSVVLDIKEEYAILIFFSTSLSFFLDAVTKQLIDTKFSSAFSVRLEISRIDLINVSISKYNPFWLSSAVVSSSI